MPFVALLQLVVVFGPAAPAHADSLIPGGATPGGAKLVVQSYADKTHGNTSEPITTYKWLISAEHTGGAYGPDGSVNPAGAKTPAYDATGDPAYDAANKGTCLPHVGPNTGLGGTYDPNACQWPSVRYTPGAVPVVAQGDQGDVVNGVLTAPTGTNGTQEPLQLQPGRYLISVTADGYKIDGAHFDIDGRNGDANVTVQMHAYPMPLGTLRLRVFKDTAPVDGTYEVGVEAPLSGFVAHLNDVMGEVTTDFWGNRLCTNYEKDANGHVVLDADGLPVINVNNPGGICLSNAAGDVVVPNIGPDRYTATVIAPSGEKWYQTTTLEGNHDWDMWIAENETGFDNEMTVGGELVPPVDMGYVPFNTVANRRDSAPPAMTGTATVKGTAVIINTYVGGTGGIAVPNAGVAGANVRGPVKQPIITLSDLDNNDQMVYVGRGANDGTFTIPNVPTGNYQLTEWDYEQDLILDSFNVTVNTAGQTVDVGQKGLVGWYTDIRGSVFIDTNGNGRRDPGEQGVPKFTLALKQRDNSLLDAGINAASTDDQGNYDLTEGYPISKFFVLEAFNTRYKTTGITVQADNEPQPRTYLGAGVDLNVLPIIGLSGRVDWGVQPYAGAENGGIVGTVTYDTTRNELDPAFAATEPYQPGIPGLKVHLYAPVACDSTDPAVIDPVSGDPLPSSGVTGVPDGSLCSVDDGYWHVAQQDPTDSTKTVLGAVQPYVDGNGDPVDISEPYVTETWDQSKECVARQFDGTELTDQWAVPSSSNNAGKLCVEAPMVGWQAIPSDPTDGAFGQTVNGNYGFGTVDHDPRNPAQAVDPETPIPNGDYIVKVEIPDVNGRPLYKPTQEEDVNVFDGDVRAPQENFPLPADTSVTGVDQSPGAGGPISQGNGFTPACAGALHKVTVTDPGFQNAGGSPYEGKARPMCDSKLINLRGGQSVAPNFNLFTAVPLPTHFWGLTINDLGLSQDRTQAGYGEAQPLPFVPMGIYDWSGRLVDTVDTDWNGMYEALEPSTSSYNCPLPAGPCPGMYYFKGNDPGQPGHVNANYNPRFRTIGTEFQAWPGLWTVTDTAPTQVGVVAVAPGSTQINPVQCDVNAGVDPATAAGQAALTPDVMNVSQPFMRNLTVVTPAVDHPAQQLPVNNIRISGSGTTLSPKTVTLTTTATISPTTPNTYAYVQLPLLSSSNASGLTAGQRTAINSTGTLALVNGQLVTRHPVSALTGSTVAFTLGGLFAGTANTVAAGVTANVTATLPAWTTPAVTKINSQPVTITGDGFGTAKGTVTLTPLGTGSTLTFSGTALTAWTNNSISFTVGNGTTLVPAGAYQLSVTGSNGREAVNGLTFHVLGTGYNPTLIQVNPPDSAKPLSSTENGNLLNLPSTAYPAVTAGDPNATPEDVLQKAVDKASSSSQALVVVWPNGTAQDNPRGEYYENLVVHSNVKIQGVGAGGTYKDGTGQHDVAGTRFDGLGFNADNNAGAAWVAKVAEIAGPTGTGISGPTSVPDAAVVTYVGTAARFGGANPTYNGALDGVTVTGGAQADQPTAITEPFGGTTTPFGAPGALVTQGGGIYVHSAANGLRLSNNVIVGNSGSYAGGIRIGTPYATDAASNGVVITRNRIRDNGGTNLAGGVGIFSGSDNYQVTRNDLCGNFSAEYGGALTQYGESDNVLIQRNRVYLNQSYDEGGGIMIAGELNPVLTQASTGAGFNIRIDANQIQDNLANDDGGGLRFLQATSVRSAGLTKTVGEIDVTNNAIVDNVSAHEGGGVALDDSVNVHITGNTIMKNLTTATAVTSNGQPAPAGLSTAGNSDQLRNALTGTTFATATYSQPQDFRDNILWGNLAGTWDAATGTVLGITPGGTGANAPVVWEAGSVDTLTTAMPIRNSVMTALNPAAPLPQGQLTVGTNGATMRYGTTANFPLVKAPYDVNVQIISSRTFPSFREAVIVANAVSPQVQGDYHLAGATSPASNAGLVTGVASTVATLLGHDLDLRNRAAGTTTSPIEIGADEIN